MRHSGTGSAAKWLLAAFVFLAGCGTQTSNPHPLPLAAKQGLVHGGEEPVSGATIQLYAVGITNIGSPATPLLTSAVLSDNNGNFTLTGKYTCPSPSSLVYVTATGGNPGLSAGTNNASLALMAALGPCGALSPSTFIFLNELTTVAAVYALAPYMTSLTAVGSDAPNAPALANAFTLASEFVNTTTGTTPGTNVPAGSAVPVQQINTLADILAACVNSAGGTAGDNSICGNLFSLTTLPAGSNAPTNTATALLQIANNPSVNTAALYNLILPNAPFQPAQPQVPPDLAVRLQTNAGLTVSPATLTFPATRVGSSSTQLITITNNTSAPVGLDAVDPENYSISGTNAGNFSPYNGPVCPTPLMPGASCTVQITFTPNAVGPFTGYYVVPNTSANPSIAVALNGTGIVASAGPASLSPSTLTLQAAATPSTLTLTNSGASPLTIDGITISNDPTSGQPAFTQTNTCGNSLPAGSNCAISVAALPTTALTTSGTLTVHDDAAAGPQTATLTFYNGFSGPILRQFPPISVGTSYTDYLNNFQAYPNALTLTITGPNATDFSFSATSSVQTATCPYGGRPPVACSNAIIFTPSGTGTRIANLNISGDNFNGGSYGQFVGVGLPTGPHLDILTVNGDLVNNTPLTSLDFGYVTLGQSATNPAQILNSGTVPLTLNPPVLSGPAASDFTATSCTTIAPGAACSISVTAHPSQTGTRSATLTFTDSTGLASGSISLQAGAYYARPVVTPSSLNFPYTPEGTVSAPISFTVSATNNDPVLIRIDLGGPNNPFILTNGNSCPATPCQLTAVYEPTAVTAAKGGNNGLDGTTFYVYDLNTLGPAQVGVSGTYLPAYVLSATPTSLEFGNQPYGIVSNPQTITLNNQGTQDLYCTLAFSPDGSVTSDPNFMAPNGPVLVKAGNTLDVSVNFYPTVLGHDTATLYILSQAPSSPIAVTLSGTGQ